MWMHGQRFGLKRRARVFVLVGRSGILRLALISRKECALNYATIQQSLMFGFPVRDSSHLVGGGPGATTGTPDRQEGS